MTPEEFQKLVNKNRILDLEEIKGLVVKKAVKIGTEILFSFTNGKFLKVEIKFSVLDPYLQTAATFTEYDLREIGVLSREDFEKTRKGRFEQNRKKEKLKDIKELRRLKKVYPEEI